MQKPEKAVAKGAKVLDKKAPNWHKKIKVTQLRMATNDKCIMGQLFKGDPLNGLVALGLIKDEDKDCNVEDVATKYGFMPDTFYEEAAFNELWRAEIKARKDADKLNKEAAKS